MKIEKIKPIPKYILKLIRKEEAQDTVTAHKHVRFYSYLTKNDGELVKVTVACKNNINSPRWRCKQVVIHGVHSNVCFVKDTYQSLMHYFCVGWYEEGLQKEQKWYEDGEWGWQYDEYFNIRCILLNPEYALRFNEYKYSALDLYTYTDTFEYLRMYEEYPQAEMLVKFGLSAYATSKQLLRKIAKDKNFCKWLIKNRLEISSNDFYISTLLCAYKTGKPLLQIQQAERDKKQFCNRNNYSNIKELFHTDKQIAEFLEYIRRQNTNISSYSDYLNACNYLGFDMSLPKNRLPHNFKKWHDIRIDEYRTAKALKDAKERKELYAKFAAIAEKYLPLQINEDETFIVIIAKSPQDLIREGELLHHCVGRMNYDQRFIREESLIFFVRDKDAPDIPFATIEYSLNKHKVLQCYGDGDIRPNEQVLDFVNNKWLPYANRQIKKIEKLTKQAA